jgi:hypothetical protein
MSAANDNLSRAVSALFRLQRDSSVAYEMDSQIDGGEWSGPASARLLEGNCEKLARRCGYAEFDALYKAVVARTSSK